MDLLLNLDLLPIMESPYYNIPTLVIVLIEDIDFFGHFYMSDLLAFSKASREVKQVMLIQSIQHALCKFNFICLFL